MKLKPKNVRKIVRVISNPRFARYLPYQLVSKQIFKFIRTIFFQQKYFINRINLLADFIDVFDAKYDNKKLEIEFGVSNFLKPWRIISISHFNSRQIRKYIKIHGLEFFKESYDKNNGVILVSSHWGNAAMSISILHHLGYGNLYTIAGKKAVSSKKFSGIKKGIEPKSIVYNDFSTKELFKVIYKARDVLNEGNILQIFGDGYHGGSDLQMQFLDSNRSFRPSFVDMGLATEAAIHPIFIYVLPCGQINVEFHKELDKGNTNLSRTERTEYILKQYIDSLEQKWRDFPQFVNESYMEKYILDVKQKHL